MPPAGLPKAYLCCSIRGGRSSEVPYDALVKLLLTHTVVLNPFVTDDPSGNRMEGGALSDAEIHDRDVRLINECDVLVAEVSQPSFGVGYEVGRAVELRKPVLCLFIPSPERKVSAMIGWAADKPSGAPVQLKSYTDEQQLTTVLKEYFTCTRNPGAVLARQASLDWNSYELM